VTAIAALVLLIGAGVTAVVVFNPVRSRASAGPTVGPTVRPTPTVPDPPPYTGRLQDLVVPVPAGAGNLRDPRTDLDGSMSRNQLLDLYPGSDAQATIAKSLTEDGFERGVLLGWADQDGVEYLIQILQFTHASGATRWSDSTQAGFSAKLGTVDMVGISDIDDGRIFTDVDGYAGAHALFSKGFFAVQIDVHGRSTSKSDAAKALAIAQYQRLP
jgi:hypothetical protein